MTDLVITQSTILKGANLFDTLKAFQNAKLKQSNNAGVDAYKRKLLAQQMRTIAEQIKKLVEGLKISMTQFVELVTPVLKSIYEERARKAKYRAYLKAEREKEQALLKGEAA